MKSKAWSFTSERKRKHSVNIQTTQKIVINIFFSDLNQTNNGDNSGNSGGGKINDEKSKCCGKKNILMLNRQLIE